jgi:hypothetical protein
MVQDLAAHDLLRRRVERVGNVSVLTARALKLTQALSGLDMDLLRITLDIGRGSAGEELVRELHETEEAVEAVQQAHAQCMAEIAAAEEDVVALDRQIAASRGG